MTGRSPPLTDHRAPPCARDCLRGQRGISLLELLVGMVVSMLTVLAITQVFLESEKQRRIPGTGAEAQINGILALDAVQRDVRQAGYGLGGGPWVGVCTTNTSSEAAAVGLSGLTLAPVTITPGSGTAPSDSIDILSSGKVDAAVQIRLAENHASGNDKFVLPSNLGMEAGEWLIVSTAAGFPCDAFQVQSLATAEPWGAVPSASVPAYSAGSRLSNMGATPIRRRWSVTGSSTSAFALQVSNLATSGAPAAEDAYPEVVLLRAFYAKDTDNNGAIDTYDATAPTDRAGWNQVIGLRLAIVVRSPHWNQEEVTPDALQWNLGSATTAAGSTACTNDASSQCIALSLTHTSTGSDWKHYRYRMYESLIPLRNLLWTAG